MKVKYEDRLKQKIIAITPDTLVVGVDIAKNYQWARFVDFRGIEHDRALKFKNRKGGFETILARIREEGKFHKGCCGNGANRALLESVCQLAGETGRNNGCPGESICNQTGKRTG